MPLYEYLCPDGHRSEDWVHTWRERKDSIECAWCGKPSPWYLSAPVVRDGDHKTPMPGQEMLSGTAFEDHDGRDNPVYERAMKEGRVPTKAQVDFGS